MSELLLIRFAVELRKVLPSLHSWVLQEPEIERCEHQDNPDFGNSRGQKGFLKNKTSTPTGTATIARQLPGSPQTLRSEALCKLGDDVEDAQRDQRASSGEPAARVQVPEPRWA
jgi:hypothetical protein